MDFGSIDAPEVETGRIMTTAGHYAFIKIAEGCDNHCSYCVIPSLRGKYRSRQMDDVLYEARIAGGQRREGADRGRAGHQPLRHRLARAQAAPAGASAEALRDRRTALDSRPLRLSRRN